MNYFLLKRKPLEEYSWLTNPVYEPKIYKDSIKGISLIDQSSYPILSAELKKENSIKTDLLNGIHRPEIISEKLKALIEEFQEDKSFLEFFPIEITYKSKKVDYPAYFINILNNIEAMDLEKSGFKYYEGTTVIESISNLILNPEKIGRRNIFRVSQIKTNICVSQVLKDKIKTSGLTGIKFVPIEDFVKE